MISRRDFLGGSIAAVAASGSVMSRAQALDTNTPLDRYVGLPTPEYRYEVLSTLETPQHRSRVLSMISQRWRSSSEVDRPLWQHWLTITEPRELKKPIALMVIAGGSNTDPPPKRIDPIIETIAVQTGTVIAVLQMVPNEPLRFSDDPKPLGEDDLIAYTWKKFLQTGDDTWPARLPMTKAVIRAMDTVTALTRDGPGPPIERFVVGGASKRGWTAWLVAAADQRVKAVVPIVIDVLNVERNALHTYQSYGFWPPAMEPYVRAGIPKWIGTPQFDALMRIIDPFSYRSRLTMPKLIVNATGDQYFPPDSSQFYYSALPGEKYLRYVPNTDHSLNGETKNTAQTGIAFLDSLVDGMPLPRYAWTTDSGGTIHVQTSKRPLIAKLWHATNHRARDFRVESIGRAYHSIVLPEHGRFSYAGRIPPPARGFAAYFIELTYETGRSDLFTVTTDVHITPNRLPFKLPRTIGISHDMTS
jgi:PhoPQ-activated pathogenicity-related protein